MNNILERIKQMKKVELHRHIEGCISPELFHKFVLKHDPMSLYSDISEVRFLYNYANFRGFLDVYGIVVDFLVDYEDFQILAESICSQLKQDNIIYVELLFSPQPFIKKGLKLHKILTKMFYEFEKAEIKSSLIIDFVRDFKEEEALETLLILLKILEKNRQLKKWVNTVSIGGDELNYPAKLFKNVFKRAKDSGLNLYAHAGEWDNASSVWDAIYELGVQRIGHGINSIQDPNLIKFLKENKIVLDISITSNYQTNSIKVADKHPVEDLYDSGVRISLNTDDSGFFHTTLNQEYVKFLGMGFTFEDLIKIRKHSIEGSFLSEEEKQELITIIRS